MSITILKYDLYFSLRFYIFTIKLQNYKFNKVSLPPNN